MNKANNLCLVVITIKLYRGEFRSFRIRSTLKIIFVIKLKFTPKKKLKFSLVTHVQF